MRRGILLLLAVASVACVSDKALVGRATAAQIWYEHEYQKQCPEDATNAECVRLDKLLADLDDAATTCNAAQVWGKLPPPARARLKTLMKELEK